jgi:hypothetical protein
LGFNAPDILLPLSRGLVIGHRRLYPLGKIAVLKHRSPKAGVQGNPVVQFRMGDLRGKFEIPDTV